ncbi:isoprenoid synthase domain-containing protein [Gautieria morchelliformis]|nr:isoprenoid synthase domain-containing protein [Gautieria morchelliformis]
MTIANDITAKCLGSNLPDNSSSNFIDDEVSILKAFVAATGYDPTDIKAANQELEDFMRAEMESGNFACDKLEASLRVSANMAEICYHDCSFPEKQNIALYTWYFIYVDDMAPKNPSSFIEFEHRFLSGRPQLDPVLDAFASVLLRMWDLYDPLCANSIIVAAFELISISCIEPEIEKLPLVQGAQEFSWFVRHRSGAGPAYALMSFTKSSQIDMMEYIQAVPFMDRWICLTNDILSFHKENLAGETGTYIHTRAYIENKAPLQVLAEIAEEMRTAINTIHLTLSDSPRALHAWEVFERGYIIWHMTQDRYQLNDLDLE